MVRCQEHRHSVNIKDQTVCLRKRRVHYGADLLVQKNIGNRHYWRVQHEQAGLLTADPMIRGRHGQFEEKYKRLQ